MTRLWKCLILAVAILVWLAPDWPHAANVADGQSEKAKDGVKAPAFTGTSSCRKCHEKFYKLWAPSHHGLAMQPYTREFAEANLSPQTEDLAIGDYRYRADISGDKGFVREAGPDGDKKYPMVHALGGKNVYYFLTPMERGRLQTLPVAYDVNTKKWFDMAKSGVRHFPGQTDDPINWKEWPYTFNTACYSCHVSQLSTNFDLKTDTYNTTWREPGINCETCHGPGEEHVRVCEAAPKGTVPKDLKMIRGGRDFTDEQNNDACSSCHAKSMPLSTEFMPGDRFFDRFDLATLEHPDFYPDGRDLGENYTFTTWRMSPCVKAGNLNCLFCHTSSGRYRHKKDPNQSCRKCHQERVDNATEHTHHKADSPGSQCIACHMPITDFARMNRTDHSMTPPTPATTIAFKSPNACNNCHKDKTPQWADQHVRKWRKKDYQAPVVERARLIDSARKSDWSKLPDMLAYIQRPDRDEIFATSLIRLLMGCDDPAKWPALVKALDDPSPLVRSAACVTLESLPSMDAVKGLLKATGDDYRVVRVRAASSLAGLPDIATKMGLDAETQKNLQKATQELVASYEARPDQWTSHYNLGNFYFRQRKPALALDAFKTALKFEPRATAVMVNMSMVYSQTNEPNMAEEYLAKALKADPKNAEANFNMGLLKAEQNDLVAARDFLQAALKADPRMHQAAYNLGVLLAEADPEGSMRLLRKAFDIRPLPKYGYTLGYYQQKKGDTVNASKTLQQVIDKWPHFCDAYLLLGDVVRRQSGDDKAAALYRQAIDSGKLSPRDRLRVQAALRALQSKE